MRKPGPPTGVHALWEKGRPWSRENGPAPVEFLFSHFSLTSRKQEATLEKRPADIQAWVPGLHRQYAIASSGDGACCRRQGRRAGQSASGRGSVAPRSEEHTSELQSRFDLVCR